MQANGIKVRLSVKNPKTAEALENVIVSDNEYLLLGINAKDPADLMIFELGGDLEKDFQNIRSLIDLGVAGDVFLTSIDFTPEVLQRAIREGVKDFFSQPINSIEVKQSLERFSNQKGKLNQETKPPKESKILTVLGSKGGIGTTTVAVNVAVSLAEADSVDSVALIDFDSMFGEIPFFLEIEPTYNWGEITKNISRLDATFLNNILVKHSSGVYVLPSPRRLNGYEGTTPEILESILLLMKKLFEYVVIDLGKILDVNSLKIIEMSDDLLMISVQSISCLCNSNDLLRSITSKSSLPEDRIKILINRYMKKSEISLKDAERSINKKIFWTIPNNYRATFSAINQGKPLSEVASKSKITKNFRQLADNLICGETCQLKRNRLLRLVGR
ncbi:Type II/IV secretion system ATPase TadZ/CpaE, associated with Flp pilus assembly [Olavius algarvensis Delta 1 endosymbiont]|nr:Type II/IV secretion system ATPase TadZ/CpaE, associated with Flp pilus assembly [Olavius algarvensis Delta 1 endosymbiont]